MGLDSCHPAIKFLFFSSVIACTIWLRHPVFLGISFVTAFAVSIRLSGKRAMFFNCILLAVLAAFTIGFASFHHFGVTILIQREAGNPITLESLVYSLVTALCIGAVILWLSCVHVVITTDQVVYLFGRISPKLSLFLSVLLRMVPTIKRQYKKIALARQAIGRGANQGNLIQRVLHFFAILSILLTWMIESFIHSSESMKSRGYTLKGRTAYSLYRFDQRDRGLLIVLFAGLLLVIMAGLLDQAGFKYSPMLSANPVTALTGVFYGLFFIYCLFPMWMLLWGDLHYKKAKGE